MKQSMDRFQKLTIDCVLETLAKENPDKPAVVFEEESITYKELNGIAEVIAGNLMELGIKKGDKAAVLLPNCLEYLYLYFALFKIGAWMVPVSTRYEPEEIGRVIEDSDAEIIIYQDKLGIFDYQDILHHKIVAYTGKIKHYILLGEYKPEDDAAEEIKHGSNIQNSNRDYNKLQDNKITSSGLPNDIVNNVNRNTKILPFCSLLDQSVKNTAFPVIEPDDVAILGYTSGTTGHPKGVMITHKNLVVTSYYGGQVAQITDEIGFSIAPLYAAQGFNAVLIYFVCGITMKWISNFNPNDILKHVTQNNINLFHTQPTMWSMILSMPYYRHVYFKNLHKVVVSGSLCTPFLAKRIEESTRCTLMNAYGIIEATGVVCMTRLDDPEDVRLNTVGRPLKGFQVKIVNEERQELPKGEIGEIAIKGFLMKGYYKQPYKTNEIIDDKGWLYTGDLGCYYKDGVNICIVGRCKDMIIRGGFNVYPVDIEECLLNFDKVEDVSVVGEEDEILGESITCFVIPKPGQLIKEGEIKAYCRGKIANYKVPDRVLFVSQFPVLESGKVQKNVLRDWAIKEIPPESRFLLNDVVVEGIAKD